MKSIIDIKNIEPSKDGIIRQEYTWLDTKYIELPNVIGMNLKEAQSTLKKFKIEYSGEGEKVLHQEPEPGIYIKENGTVKLMLQ